MTIEVGLIFNDCSIHGQFHDLTTFEDAIGRVMAMRTTASRFGRELYCHRNVVNAQVTRDLTMPQAVQSLSIDKRRALMQWLTRYGPFWEDVRQHTGDDYLECRDDIVTDTAVGEAAYCCFQEIDRALVSINPSAWLTSPLSVNWYENEHVSSIDIHNYWDVGVLEASLESVPVILESWADLEQVARHRCLGLTFSPGSFGPLNGHPFVRGAAERLLLHLNMLDKLTSCFDEHGRRTSEGHWIVQNHFTGGKALFSDSSDTEKTDFENDLTFPHPARPGEYLFASWHSKVKTPQLRIHFAPWPIRANEPAYVVYVGPKITKR